MNERIRELADQAELTIRTSTGTYMSHPEFNKKFAELMHRQVIASILITDVVMEEKGQVPTSEDYIRAINKDFGVEE